MKTKNATFLLSLCKAFIIKFLKSFYKAAVKAL